MDKQKADEILTEYLPKIYGFAIKKAFSYAEAEDICADIVEELYKSLIKANEIYNLEGYIWRISCLLYTSFRSAAYMRRIVTKPEPNIGFMMASFLTAYMSGFYLARFAR